MADGLNLKLLEEFNKQLDETYTKLIQLDNELKQFEKLTTVDVKVGPGIRATSRALDELARAMQRFSSASPERISSAAENIKRFVDQFDAIDSSNSSDQIKSLGKFFSALSTVFSEIGKVQAQFAIFSAAGNAKTAQVVKDVVQPLFAVVATLINQGKDITPERLKGLSLVFLGFETLFKTLADVTTSLGAITSGAGPGKALGVISSLLSSLNLLIQNSKDITPERIKQLAGVMSSFGTLLRSIQDALTTLGAGSSGSLVGIARNFVTVQAVLLPFIRSIKTILTAASDLRPGSITAVAQIFEAIPVFLREVQNVFAIVRNMNMGQFLKSVLGLQILLFQLVGTIGLVIKASSKVPSDSLRGLGDIFKGFASAMTALIPLLKLVGESSIKDTLKNAVKVQIALLPFILSIVGIVKLLGKNARVDSGIGALFTGLANVISPLINLVKLFSKVKDLKEIAKIGAGLTAVIKPLIDFTKAIGKIDSRKFDAKGLGDLFTGVGRVVTDLSALDDQNLNDKKLNTVFGTLKRVTDVLKTIKVDRSVATALAAISQILEKLGQPSNGKGMDALEKAFASELPASMEKTKDEAKDLGETIEESILGAAFKLDLLKAGFNALAKVVRVGIGLYKDFFFPPTIIANNLNTLKAIGDALRDVGDQLRDVGEQMRSFGTELITNFGLGALFSSGAVQSAIGFDQLSTQVQVFGNLSDEATESAEALAFEIGQKYPLSANDALAATLDLIKAGQQLGDIEFTLPAAADLAALSETGDLDGVINTLIAAEGAFDNFRVGVEGTFENIAIATDIIAAGANVSTASVESLGEGLANSATAANSFGLTMEETVAVLSIFNDAGLKAGEGGTALRSLLNALDRPQTAIALRNLGLSLFDDAGNRKPLNEIINDINGALEGMPEAQRVQVLNQLADTFGRQGLSILLAEGEDGILNVVDAMNALPTAAEQATQLLNNLAGDMEQLKGSFETFLLRAALPMIDRFFRPIVQILRAVVDGVLTLDESFFEFIGTATALLSIGATLVGGFAVFAGVILQVGGAVFTVVGTLLNFQLVLGAIAAGISGFLVGAAAIAAGLVVFVPIVLAATAGFEALFEIFSTNAGGATSAAQAFFGTILSTAKTVVDFVGSFLNLIGTMISANDDAVNATQEIGTTIASFFSGLSRFFTSGFLGDVRIALGQVTQVFDAFASILDLKGQLEEMASAFDIFSSSTQGFGRERVQEMALYEEAIARIEEQIRTTVAGLIQNVPLFRDAVQRMFGDTSDASIQAFVDQLFGAFNKIAQGFSDIQMSVIGFVSNIRDLGLGEAFRVLGQNLDSALGNIVSGFFDAFVLLFGDSGNEYFQYLKTSAAEGFSTFVGALVQTIVSLIRNTIIGNRDAIKDAFLTVVDMFFAGLRNLRFITDLLGAGPISDLFESFQDVLKNLLGGIFDTLINLLEGQDLGTALHNAFGDAILPLFDFVDAISSIGSTLGTLFGNFIDFLFPPGDPTISEAAQEQFDFLGFIDDITDFLNNLNRLFLNPLAIGDFGTFASNIGGFVESFLTSVREQVSTFVTGSPDSDYLAIGQTIVDKVAKGVSDAFLNFASALNIDPTAFITSLQESFSPLTSALESLFSGTEEDPSVLQDIVTIIERMSTAFNNLFASTEEAPAEGQSPLQFILDFVGNLAALGIDILTSVIDTINAIFDALANANAQDITAIGLALALVFAPFIGTALGTGIVAVGTALQGLWASALLPLLGFVSAGLIIKAFIDNLSEFGEAIDSLVEGDIMGFFTDLADAIGKTFIDFGLPVVNSLLDFFGIDTDYTNEQIRMLAEDLANTVVNAFRLAGLLLERFAAQAAADASITARRAQDALTFGDDKELGTASNFFDVEKDFSLESIRALEADLSAQGFTLRNSITADFAVTNQDEVAAGIMQSLGAAISEGNPVPLTPEDIITLQNLEILPRLLEDAIFQGNFDIANAILAASGSAPLDADTVRTLVDNITFAVQSGLLTAEEAQALLLPLKVEPGEITGGDITPEEQNAIIDAALDTVTPEEPVEVEVPVEPVPVVVAADGETPVETLPPPDDFTTLEAEAQDTQAGLQGQGGLGTGTGLAPAEDEEVPPTAPAAESGVSEELDLAGADAQDVAQLTADLTNLQTYARAVKIDLDALLPTLVQLGVDLGTGQVAFDAINASMIIFSTSTFTLNLTLLTMQVTLGLINLSLLNLGINFLTAGLLGALSFLQLGIAVATFEGQLVTMLNTLIQGFIIVERAANRLATIIAGILGNAQALVAEAEGAGGDGEGDGGTPDDEGAPHAQGGSFDGAKKKRGFGKYRINEGGSEVLFENGKMYLLSSGRGQIATLNKGLDALPRNSSSTGVYPQGPSTSAGRGGNTNNVNVEGSEVNITIDGSSADPAAIGREVSKSVREEMNQQNSTVRRELRRTHR